MLLIVHAVDFAYYGIISANTKLKFLNLKF